MIELVIIIYNIYNVHEVSIPVHIGRIGGEAGQLVNQIPSTIIL